MEKIVLIFKVFFFVFLLNQKLYADEGTINVSTPSNLSSVNGTVTLSANVSGNFSTAGVQFKIDGKSVGSEDITPPYSIQYNTSGLTNGSHLITATARDVSNNYIVSSSVFITVTGGVALNAHPRLWLTSADIARLRSWAVASNPVYQDGLRVVAQHAKADMDAGLLTQDQGAWCCNLPYPREVYAMTFAFMSLIENNASVREDYAQRAKTLLMYMMNEAAKGASANQPYRDARFSTRDRAHFWGEAFGLTVDWIYPYLSASDKATIRTVFLRWSSEILQSTVTGSYAHPVPVGMINNPALLQLNDPALFALRFSLNNHFTFHARNLALISMALDPADDPGNQLGAYLDNAIGAWLYMTDYATRNQIQNGGDWPEGWGYVNSGLGSYIHFLLALKTAGKDNPALYGAKVVAHGNPVIEKVVPAYLHSFSNTTSVTPDFEWYGPSYQPAWHGDGSDYVANHSLKTFGALGLYDYYMGNQKRLSSIRWILKNLMPGGPAYFLDHIAASLNGSSPRNAMFAFMLFDPQIPAEPDPRPEMDVTYFGNSMNRLLARTGWGPDASWITYKLNWNRIDHQHGDGNMFEFYRKGEWLIKNWVGYGAVSACSDYHNSITIKNDAPAVNYPGGFQNVQWNHGSQWQYIESGDPVLVAKSFRNDFIYLTGDATPLYNSTMDNALDVLHVSRSLVWLKPDHLILYDRTKSKSTGRFKRFWLNFASTPVINGKMTTSTSAGGQKIFVNTLLPAAANLSINTTPPNDLGYDETAAGESMQFRLKVEAIGDPQSAQFLHVIQGADAGITADTTHLIQSKSGTFYEGVVVKQTAILFPVQLNATFTGVTYEVPNGTAAHIITGLAPLAGYNISMQNLSNKLEVSVTPNGSVLTDEGGVLSIGIGGPVNQPPVADAGSNQTVTEGAFVTLNGSESSDPENSPLTYTWTKLSGPAISISNANTSQAGFTAPFVSSNTILNIKLQVTDTGNASAQDTVSITIQPSPDNDSDGLRNAEEAQLGTNPNDADSDDDGFNDGQEAAVGTDPLDDESVPALIKITADNQYVLYVNGLQIGSNGNWQDIESYWTALEEGDLISIETTDQGGIAALACQIEKQGKKQVSDFTWHVSNAAVGGWQNQDDETWANATEHFAMGQGPWGNAFSNQFSNNVKWIWSSDAANHNKSYFWTKYSPSQNTVIKVTADNQFDAYINEALAGSGNNWSQVKFFSVHMEAGDIFSLQGIDSGGKGGLLAEIFYKDAQDNMKSFVTDSSWKYTTTPVSGWLEKDFDDSAWPDTISYGARGVSPWGNTGSLSSISATAQWIWSAQENLGSVLETIYARKIVPNAAFIFSCDNSCEVYVNGKLAGTSNNWSSPKNIALYLKNNDVIGVKGMDQGGLGGFIGILNYDGTNILTNKSWKMSSVFESGWNTSGFNAASWNQAESYGSNGVLPWNALSGISSQAQWIWSPQRHNDDTVYFRYTVGQNNASTGLTSFNITADDAFKFYHNGELMLTGSNWKQSKQIQLELETNDILALEGNDAGYKAGLLIQTIGAFSLHSDTTWKVLAAPEPPAQWNTAGFNDLSWSNATSYGNYPAVPWGANVAGIATPTPAQWIWSNKNQTGTSNIDSKVMFRKKVP